jgi:hypothetical protein
MNGTKRIWAFLVMCLFLGSAVGARGAAGYTLSCEPARGDAITIVLTGFNFKVMGGGSEAATGMSAGRATSKFELSVRFPLNKNYEVLAGMAEDNEVLRSCKLTDSDVSGGTTASDDWNQASTKSKNNKVKNAAPAAASSGAYEWILTNATITSISAIGGETSSGAPESSVQAIIEAQKYSFTM